MNRVDADLVRGAYAEWHMTRNQRSANPVMLLNHNTARVTVQVDEMVRRLRALNVNVEQRPSRR